MRDTITGHLQGVRTAYSVQLATYQTYQLNKTFTLEQWTTKNDSLLSNDA